jgi:cytochrome c peroxidase
MLLAALLTLVLDMGTRAAEVGAPAPAASSAFYASSFSKLPSVPAMTALGRALFFDRNLSASGRMACATCHDPKFAYGPASAAPVVNGGAHLDRPGLRAIPSLRYTQNVPPFSEQPMDEAGEQATDQGPAGGRTWDGRASSAHDQALLPLLSSFEMANVSSDAVVDKVVRSQYAASFRETFGSDVFSDPERAFKAVLLALEVYQQSPVDFYPYSSRYDDWLRGRIRLSVKEQRGLALFSNPAKGNCAQCHPSQIRRGAFPQFTDFGFVALGVPRNRFIAANADPWFHDLGLCGPERTDLRNRPQYCGKFRTPTLRNVALRCVFFHNGAFHSLRGVVEFYAERDLEPQRWYPKDPDGRVRIYDDLPTRYRGNVDHEPPLDRKPGEAPALSAADVDDMLAFLRTLTDADLVGHRPATACRSSP